MSKPYRPSNGSEGASFTAAWCEAGCTRYQNHRCGILLKTMVLTLDDPGYPEEWTEKDGVAGCSAFTTEARAKSAPKPDPRQIDLF